jgi:hypothetical protein
MEIYAKKRSRREKKESASAEQIRASAVIYAP